MRTPPQLEITNFDFKLSFFSRELEQEVVGETMGSPLDRMNQSAQLDMVEICQFGAQRHLVPANQKNGTFDAF